jgi:hypothetical protein
MHDNGRYVKSEDARTVAATGRPTFPQAPPQDARKAVKLWKKEKVANCDHCLVGRVARPIASP